MKLKALMGAGDFIIGCTLPFAAAGIVLNIVFPGVFTMYLGIAGLIAGLAFLAAGLPLWLAAAIQILVWVPKNKLITTGPFALVLHPIYTFFGLLVIPGISFVLDTWVGFAIGIVLYVFSRIFSGREEKELGKTFGPEYDAYRAKVLLPWL